MKKLISMCLLVSTIVLLFASPVYARDYAIQVSSHGQSTGKTFTAEDNFVYNFFVKQGLPLCYPTSEQIYKDLAANKIADVEKKVQQKLFAGAKVEDYNLWSLNDPKYVSGVLEAGSTKAVVDISKHTPTSPISLSALIKQAINKLGIKVGTDKVTVYYNACRS